MASHNSFVYIYIYILSTIYSQTNFQCLLSIYSSITYNCYLSIYLSIILSIYLSVYHVFILIYLPIYLSDCCSLYLSIYLIIIYHLLCICMRIYVEFFLRYIFSSCLFHVLGKYCHCLALTWVQVLIWRRALAQGKILNTKCIALKWPQITQAIFIYI